MPPKKKARTVAGQKQLMLKKENVILEDFGSDASTSVHSSSDSTCKQIRIAATLWRSLL